MGFYGRLRNIRRRELDVGKNKNNLQSNNNILLELAGKNKNNIMKMKHITYLSPKEVSIGSQNRTYPFRLGGVRHYKDCEIVTLAGQA